MMDAYKLIYITRFKVFEGAGTFFKKFLRNSFWVQGLSQSPALICAGAFFKSPAYIFTGLRKKGGVFTGNTPLYWL